jgi:hypothetical protein
VVSFMGDGFIELDGHNLGRKSSIGLVFATTQPDALLLFSDPYKLEVGLMKKFILGKFKFFFVSDWTNNFLHSFSAQRTTACESWRRQGCNYSSIRQLLQ